MLQRKEEDLGNEMSDDEEISDIDGKSGIDDLFPTSAICSFFLRKVTFTNVAEYL